MKKKTKLASIYLKWIKVLPVGQVFRPSDIYAFLETNHADEARFSESAETEPRYRNDARWAIKEAHKIDMVEHVKHSVWRRIQAPLEKLAY